MTSRTIEFFYDFSSPYAYLAHEEIERVAAAQGASVIWRPFLLGGLFRNLGIDRAPILNSAPNKVNILMTDMFRWADARQLPFAWPAEFPLNSVKALRVMCQLDGPQHRTVAGALFRAYWGQGANLADAAVLGGLLRAQGHDAGALLAGTDTAAVKQRLIDASAEAFARGACGAPSIFVGSQLVWGNDRMEFVTKLLQGWQPHLPQ